MEEMPASDQVSVNDLEEAGIVALLKLSGSVVHLADAILDDTITYTDDVTLYILFSWTKVT